MPRIRGSARISTLTPERRQELLSQLREELGTSTPRGPVIFEIPLEESDRIDVLVIWDAWAKMRSEDRTSIIQDAYGDDRSKIALALGVTYEEAKEQQALPYSVVPIVRRGEIGIEELRAAMLDEGGFALENGNIDLRFPTMALAENAHQRLSERFPNGYWSIVQSVS